MERKNIVIGCDHIVTPIKNKLRDILISQGHNVLDVGTYDQERTHYPIYGKRLAEEVVNNNYDFGIAICGTGVGVTNAAQKIKGARVVLVRDLQSAKIGREQYDANIIGFGGNIVGLGIMEEAVEIFGKTKFSGNQELIDFINNIVSEQANSDKNFSEEQDKWDKGFYHD